MASQQSHLSCLAGVLALVSGMSLNAGEISSQNGDCSQSTLAELWEYPQLYKNPDNPLVQQFHLTGIVQWQYAHLDTSQGHSDEHEFRRFRFGVDTRFLNHLAFRGKVNFDPDGDRFYKSLSQTYLSYSPYGNAKSDFESFSGSVGKIKAKFSKEHSTSPKRIKTFERSLLANQLAPAKTTTVQIAGSHSGFDYSLSALAGEFSRELSHFDNGTLLLAKLGFEPKQQLYLGIDYLAVFGDQEVTSDIKQSISLSASHNDDYQLGPFAWMADALFGAGKHSQPDVYGLLLMSSYQPEPHWEIIARYQFARSDGANGLQLQRRYERTIDEVSDGGRGESYQAGYLGATYRMHGDKLKLMAGTEYSRMNGGNDDGDFNGWTWFLGVRSYF